MKYDFDKLTNRRGTNSYKWDECPAPDVLPAWVADMDFATAPCITEALAQRVAHGIFGYTFVPDSYYEALADWWQRRHGLEIKRQWVEYTSGVVPALSVCIKALANEGDGVIVQTPVYNCFFSSIRNNGCHIVENALRRHGDTYVMDYDDLAAKAADPHNKLMILCNPHNPAGRVWKREELERLGNICRENGVIVISDEIHCELTMPGYDYTPFAAVSSECRDNSVMLCSPSKAFNTAGLQIANIVTNNADRRRMINRAINVNEVCDVNPFGVIALEAAYRHGEEWLDELRNYLYANYQILHKFFATDMPLWNIIKLEGTYLVWVDIRATGLSSQEIADGLLHEAKVWVNSGTLYGEKEGEGYIRINIACPRQRLEEILRRMAIYYNKVGFPQI